MGDRRQARTDAGGTLTERDVENLDAFAVKLDEAVALLQREIEAINSGALSMVSDLYEEKSAILKWLELKMPLVEPFMSTDPAITRKLPEKLQGLKDIVAENSALLSRMAQAAGSVVREIEKATQRHSLNGLYGKSGQKLNDPKVAKMTIDQEF
ncbi:flagellar biosynthesis protein FlgI [Cognatishimia sp. SS12]|uniref:flagellar biosynthesis protein FlgI n=1 Tax=Cognatishimia sp. SS12 TaxID=2979465 RepID=UPI00232C1624|nr:flagellar biosynthesis protein FlgI [Cognatishimia sp. SS12]MDC0739469.1 flagellar biosynthesis protein FlgI [Cognatishimia sp. SS12]